MGNVIKRVVAWVGNVFNRVINWFKDFMGGVNNKTEKFIEKKKEEIKKCKDPKAVGQYLAGKHEANQIQKIADNFRKDLSPEDLKAADKILESERFDDDDDDYM
jgi:hypothetical protein